MKDPFRNLEKLQRDLDDIAMQLTRTHFVHFNVPKGWQPALNAFRCGETYVVCLELAGVERDAIHVRAEARRLIVSGTRTAPEPPCDEPPALHVLALEIDHGPFERIIEFPADVEPSRVTAEHRNGLLWIKLPLRTHG